MTIASSAPSVGSPQEAGLPLPLKYEDHDYGDYDHQHDGQDDHGECEDDVAYLTYVT